LDGDLQKSTGRAAVEAPDLSTEEIRRRFVGGVAANDVEAPAAVAAARAAGQAVGIGHMGAHALGAAAFAVEAPDRPK
jgi:hypothetical protein